MERFIECKWSKIHLIGDNGTVKSLLKRVKTRYGTDVLKGLIKPDGYKMYWITGKWYYCRQLVAIHFYPQRA